MKIGLSLRKWLNLDKFWDALHSFLVPWHRLTRSRNRLLTSNRRATTKRKLRLQPAMEGLEDRQLMTTVAFATYAYTASEDIGSKSVTVELSGTSTDTITIDYSTGFSGTPGTISPLATSGTDFTSTSGTLTFTPGQTSKTFSVPITDDSIDEFEETLGLYVSNPTNAALGGYSWAFLTIIDDDAPPTVSLEHSAYSVAEDAGSIDIKAILTGNQTAKTIYVAYATADVSAAAGSDYTSTSGSGTGGFIFAPGDRDKTINVPIANDMTAESDETFTLTLSTPYQATDSGLGGTVNRVNLGSPNPATITIHDSALSIGDVQVVEGSGGGTVNLVFTVSLAGWASKTVTVDFTTATHSGGSYPATSTTDYTSVSGTLTFTNEPSKTISVPIVKDGIDEYDQTFLVNLSNATASAGTISISDSQAIGTINDDDDPPIVQFSEARYSQDEGGDTGTTTATFTVILSEKSEKSATKVSYITRGCGCTSSVFGMILDYSDPREANKAPDPLDKNLALEGVDFIPASGFVTFAINDKDDQVVEITLIRDDFEEEPKDINLFLLSPVYASLTGIKTAKLSILDDDTEYTFDENDRLTEVEFSDETTKEWAYNVDDTIATSTDENGAVKTYTYDGYGFVRTTVDATNLTTTYVHSSQGVLLSKTVPDPDGAGPLTASTTTYTYDSGRLTQITHPDLSTHEYSYDSRNNLLTDRDELGHTTTYVYDSVNHRISQTDATGGTTTYTYDANGGLETITDPLNRVTTYVHDAHGWVIRQILPDPDGAGAATSPITTLTYNAAGQTLTTIDPLGRTTSMTYYSDGRLQTIERPDPDGAGPLTSAVTTFVYDSGARTETRIDPSGARTTSAHNARGWQTATIDPSGAITTQTYDATGRASASVSAGSLPTTTIYDAAGRAIATIDENGHRTTTIYDGRGHVQATVDPFGNRSTFIYDALDRQIATIDPYGHTSTAVYDAANHTIASIDVFGNRTTYVYDNAGRQIATVDPSNNRTTTVFDAAGHVIANIDAYGNRTTSVYDNAGRQIATINPDNQISTTVYDAASQIVETIDPYGQRTTFVYENGQRTVVIDPFGHRATTVYDSAGRTIESIDIYGHATTFLYDAADRQNATIDVFGHRSTTTYNAAGQVEATIDAFGQRVTYSYDSAGRTIATLDSLGNRTTTVYDSYGRIEATFDRRGSRTTVFDSRGRVEATIGVVSNRTTTLYDAYGRAEATVDARGNRTTSVYDSQGRYHASIDALGNRTTSVYDGRGRAEATIDALGNRTTTVYDSRGRYEATIDALGNRTTVVYDSLGRTQANINALGNRTTTVYDSRGRYEATIDALNNRTTAVYDAYGRTTASINALGNRTTTLYDAYGRAEATINPLGNRTTTVYDAYSRQIATVDALTGRVTYAYDTHDRRTSVTDPVGNITTSVYDSLGREIETIDPLGNSATFSYDALDRLSYSSDRIDKFRTFFFDAVGNKTVETWYSPPYTGAIESTLTFTYDAVNNQLTAITTAYTYDRRFISFSEAPDSGTWLITIDGNPTAHLSYVDSASEVRYAIEAVLSSNSWAGSVLVSGTTATGFEVILQNGFIPFNLSVSVYVPSNPPLLHSASTINVATTSQGVAAATQVQTISITADDGQWTLGGYTLDWNATASNIETAVESSISHGVSVSGSYGSYTVTWDTAGSMSSFSVSDSSLMYGGNPGSISTQVTVTGDDGVREVQTITLADSPNYGSWAVVGFSNVIGFDASASEVESTLDWISLGVGVTGSSGSYTVTFDTPGNKDAINADGSYHEYYNVGLHRTVSANVTPSARIAPLGYSLQYDALGRVSSVVDDHGKRSTFSYDAVGNRTKVEDAFSGIETSVYDAQHRLTQRTYSKPITGGPDATTRTDFTYDAVDAKISESRYSDLSATTLVSRTTTTYDVAHHITSLLTKNAAGTTLADFQYTYDAQGRMTVQNDNGTLSTYSYDTTDQLTGEDTTGTDGTYTYDANGNRTMSGYDTDADNRLASDGTWDYTYDAEGNMTEKEAVVGNMKWTYGYNHRNQLLRADRKSDGSSIDLTVNYAYDAWGNRVTKAVDLDGPGIGNLDVTFFALDGWNPANPTPIGTENFHVWADLAIDGSLKTRYLHGDAIDQLIARIDAVGTHPGTYWHLTDHLGSIRKIIDNTGTVKDSLTYNAIGTITAETDPDYRGRYTYTGREFEVETGLQYNRARYYDPSIGRWISKDPLGFDAGDSNLYRYVSNAPTNHVDPSGLDMGITGSDFHTGVSVDAWLYLPTKVQISCVNGRTNKSEFKYFHVGRLDADYQAKQWAGQITIGEVFGTKGAFKIGFLPDRTLEAVGGGPRWIRTIAAKDPVTQDVDLATYIFDAIGQPASFLMDRLRMSVIPKDTLISQTATENTFERTYDFSELPIINESFDGAGAYQTYSALWNSCNSFTAKAIEQYIGYEWIFAKSFEGEVLLRMFDAAVRQGTKRLNVPAGYPDKLINGFIYQPGPML